MMKSSLIALAAAVALAGAAPAFAAPFGDGDSETREWRANNIIQRLHDNGVNATDVEEWGDLVRAYVRQADGSVVMQYFTPDTLTPVNR